MNAPDPPPDLFDRRALAGAIARLGRDDRKGVLEAVRRALEAPREIEPPELEQMKGEGTPVRRRRG